jgi:hypothetical protein
MGGGFEDFSGSLVLSDPATSVLGDGETDTRGDFATIFNITGFNVASANYALTQAGPSSILEYWEQAPPSTFINTIDSEVFITTDKGTNDFDFSDWNALITWNAAPGERPASFHYLTEVWGDYRVRDMSATVIPVPAAIWLLGSGLLGMIYLTSRNHPS